MSWIEQAGCAGMAPDFDDDWLTLRHIVVCAECPVASECLLEGLSLQRHEDFGIWGGTDRAQRMMIRRGVLTVQDVWAANVEALEWAHSGLPSES